MEARRPNRPMVIAGDRELIPRVKQYLEENVHQTYVDVGVMARHLQEKYRDYARRKVQPFRYLVDQAYKTVLHSYGLDSNPSSEDDENSDLELMEDTAMQSNHMNNMLTSMYAGGNANREATTQNEFPIDISSDESDGENSEKRAVNNGHATVVKVSTKEITTPKASAPIETLASFREEQLSKPHSSTVTVLPTIVRSPSTPSSGPTKKRRIDGKAMDDNGMERNPTKSLLSRQHSKKFKKEFSVRSSEYTFESIGGVDKILKELCELLLHIKHPTVYKKIGLPPPRGFLLHGPPGCGKTLLAQAIAGQLRVGLIQVAATELVSGVSGESEERIRDLFEQAALSAPCVLFIDEIDTISANRVNAQKDMERRIVAQLITSLDDLPKLDRGEQVLVIGATNRADTLDPALRRVGRFDQEICLGIPDRDARTKILRIICKNLRLESFFDYDSISALTPGFVGADLLALATRAASLAVRRILHDKQESALKESVSGTGDKVSSTVPADINISDALLMQIDGELTQAKSDDEEALNLPSSIGAMEIEGENKPEKDQSKSDKVSVPDTAAETKTCERTEIIDATTAEAEKSIAKENENAEHVKSSETADEPQKPSEESKDNKNHETSAESMVVDGTTDETLGEALLKNSAIKNQMGLDVMFKWLSNTDILVSEDDLNGLYITMSDFKNAVKLVQPSAKREGFITVPDVTWDDIGSLRDIRQELNLAILAPVRYPNRLRVLGINAPSGVLLCGPPGCGKTLLAKAIANEAGINFISVKGPELLNMYVGESERAVRQCFQRGRNSAPCVIFFDEFDALCPKRNNSSDGNASSRVVNQLLTEMDGVEDRKGVFIMAATNRPDIVDPAVLRPGRLDKILYVGLPTEQDRFEILQAQTKKGKQPTLADDVNLEDIAKQTDAFTGADLAGLVRQASLQALKDSMLVDTTSEMDIDLRVHNKHFVSALQHLRPSVSNDDKVRYEKLRLKYTAVPDK